MSLRLFINKNLLLFGNKLSFKFISLEKSLIDHITKIQNKKCIYCGKNNKSCFICLLCGEKLCDSKSCIPKENNIDNKFSFLFHSKICNFGNIAYISDFGKIIFYYHGKSIYFFNGIYLNKYGEEYKDGEPITNDYLLVEKNYQKIEKKFIDYSYRKKV